MEKGTLGIIFLSWVAVVWPLNNLYLSWNSSPFAEILWREWEDFSTQPDAQGLEAGDGPQFQFTLMSYNILAQDLMQQSSELYLHCHPDILNWNYRFANLMQEFQHWDPDVSKWGDMPSCIGSGPGLFPSAFRE
jgi:protein angel